MPGRAQARGEMDVEADEPVARVDRDAGVEAHADADGRVRGQATASSARWACGGGRDGVGRRVEDGERLVGAALDLAPAMARRERGGWPRATSRGRRSTLVELADVRGRPLDVGEEEGELLGGHNSKASGIALAPARRPAPDRGTVIRTPSRRRTPRDAAVGIRDKCLKREYVRLHPSSEEELCARARWSPSWSPH